MNLVMSPPLTQTTLENIKFGNVAILSLRCDLTAGCNVSFVDGLGALKHIEIEFSSCSTEKHLCVGDIKTLCFEITDWKRETATSDWVKVSVNKHAFKKSILSSMCFNEDESLVDLFFAAKSVITTLG